MESYTRLSGGAGSPTENLVNFTPPFTSEYEDRPPSRWTTLKAWLGVHMLGRPQNQPPASGYLTLIPLSDSRLKPRGTKLLVAMLILFGVAVAFSVFVLVPRGVGTGEISIQSDHMSWNITKGTYQLNLLATVPIFNPNFFQASIEGDLKVYFYDTEAGVKTIDVTRVAARASPYKLQVVLDASNVPSRYALTILSECAAFPRRLVFFLKGSLEAKYLAQRQQLSPIDTYFMIDCVNGGSVPEADSTSQFPSKPP